jgi:glycosyltransferase involved in cell wall biosynthesis
MHRWYAFTRMQARVARRLPQLIAVSESTRSDAMREMGVDIARTAVVHNGVDGDLYRPIEGGRRIPGRIVTTASADVPLKGLAYLIEAVAKVATERAVELVVVGTLKPDGPAARAIDRFGLADRIRFVGGIDSLELVELYSTASVAVVPSLYEGFSLPAAEAMACAVPLIATSAGALPEVVGPDGECALVVPPRDAEALATAIRTALDDDDLRAALGRRGRARVLERFTWKNAARATVDRYRAAMETLSC